MSQDKAEAGDGTTARPGFDTAARRALRTGALLIRTAGVAALLACGALGGGVAAAAEPLPAPGTLYRGFITVAHKQIPLPPAVWQVAGREGESLTPTPPGAYGVMKSLVLFKQSGAVIEAFVVIHANALPVERGWGTSSECAGKSLPLTRVYTDAGTNLLCAFGGPVTLRRDAGAPRFWLQALAEAGKQGLTLPDRWLMSGFRISDRHDVVEVHYHFQPVTASSEDARPASPPGVIAASWPGFEGGTARPASGDPWLASLTAWSEAMKAPIEQGFKGRLASREDGPRLPSGPAAAAAQGTATDKPPTAGPSQFQKSVIKMASWKVLGISAGLVIKYVFLGDIMMAVGLQVATTTVTGVLFVAYDMMWATVFPDSRKSLVDFTSVTVSS